jgi:hypothetical protein
LKRYKAKWLQQQHKRIAQAQAIYIDKESGTPKTINHERAGLLWGAFMFIALTIFVPPLVLVGTGRFDWVYLVRAVTTAAGIGIVVCPVAGWFMGSFLRRTDERKGDPSFHLTFDADGSIVASSFGSEVNNGHEKTE